VELAALAVVPVLDEALAGVVADVGVVAAIAAGVE
jgi:hypothetical protein